MANYHYIVEDGIEREFIEVDRKAREGDYVIVTKDGGSFVKTYGKVIERDYDEDAFYIERISGDYIEDGYVWATFGDRYKTLECVRIINRVPLESKSSEDLLANLAHRMTKLERKLSEISEQVDSNTRDIRTIGEEVAEFKQSPTPYATQAEIIDINERVEMLIDDVVTLDERSQCLTEQGIEQLAKDLVGLINERMRRL